MSDYLHLRVPEESKSSEIIESYYDHYIDRVGTRMDVRRKEQYPDYSRSIDKWEKHQDVRINEQLLTGIVKKMDKLPSDISDGYSEGAYHFSSEISLARLARELERARTRLHEENDEDLELYYNRAIDGYIAMIDFAIEKGCKIVY